MPVGHPHCYLESGLCPEGLVHTHVEYSNAYFFSVYGYMLNALKRNKKGERIAHVYLLVFLFNSISCLFGEVNWQMFLIFINLKEC